ncbi:small MutS related family protein [Heterostelium album PN500]|uniref:Sugar transporter SWEET1 n=1 Tax=Heterostelium pallidum (strain ATCC 26659 / Pp 5 / PN500) TaxID=670386 RepID=D3AWK9_HETP5|nr:small MutS related family protein [Heterostelium album PN500]EFA86682.1 small MutS related family protein [Heterostelium album PN500]|eukprot:XP_020438786.1 small MutS related family protein [Heterostelium album PN500]
MDNNVVHEVKQDDVATKDSLFLQVISSACIVITLILFVVPYKAIKIVIEKKSVGNLAGMQFISSLLNCCNWVLYSLLLGNGSILFVNGLGALSAAFYVFNYWRYVSPGSAAKDFQNKLSIATLIFGATILFTFTAPTPQDRRDRLGLIASTITVLNYASPLEKLKQVIAKRNSEGMVVEIALISLACSLSWSTLGILLNDVYIYLPNILASILSTVQCSLIFIYPAHANSKLQSYNNIQTFTPLCNIAMSNNSNNKNSNSNSSNEWFIPDRSFLHSLERIKDTTTTTSSSKPQPKQLSFTEKDFPGLQPVSNKNNNNKQLVKDNTVVIYTNNKNNNNNTNEFTSSQFTNKNNVDISKTNIAQQLQQQPQQQKQQSKNNQKSNVEEQSNASNTITNSTKQQNHNQQNNSFPSLSESLSIKGMKPKMTVASPTTPSYAQQANFGELKHLFYHVPTEQISKVYESSQHTFEAAKEELTKRYGSAPPTTNAPTTKETNHQSCKSQSVVHDDSVAIEYGRRISWSETGESVSELYSQFRDEAILHARERNRCFDLSIKHFGKGEGEKAKKYSLEGQKHDRKMKELHEKAKKEIFNARNKNNPHYIVDLHGLHVKEALEIIEQKYLGRVDPLYLIIGTGHHSTMHCRLPRRVKQFITDNGYSYRDCSTDRREGMIVVSK